MHEIDDNAIYLFGELKPTSSLVMDPEWKRQPLSIPGRDLRRHMSKRHTTIEDLVRINPATLGGGFRMGTLYTFFRLDQEGTPQYVVQLTATREPQQPKPKAPQGLSEPLMPQRTPVERVEGNYLFSGNTQHEKVYAIARDRDRLQDQLQMSEDRNGQMMTMLGDLVNRLDQRDQRVAEEIEGRVRAEMALTQYQQHQSLRDQIVEETRAKLADEKGGLGDRLLDNLPSLLNSPLGQVLAAAAMKFLAPEDNATAMQNGAPPPMPTADDAAQQQGALPQGMQVVGTMTPMRPTGTRG